MADQIPSGSKPPFEAPTVDAESDAVLGAAPGAAPGKPLSEPARRALLEAAARRAVQHETREPGQSEQGGPKGLEPTRFGDWERKGLAVDF